MKEAVKLGLHHRAILPCKLGYDVFSWNRINWSMDGLLFNSLFELQFSQCCLLNTLSEQNIVQTLRATNFLGKAVFLRDWFTKCSRLWLLEWNLWETTGRLSVRQGGPLIKRMRSV